jgi:septum formation protein
MRYILASKSPRRRELISRIIDEFDIVVSEVDESLPLGVHPMEGVELLSVRKGEAVIPLVDDGAVIISSDTLVEYKGIALGKPVDAKDAHRMLRMLSGVRHNVHTGVAVHYKGRCYSGVSTTEVEFFELSDERIDAYIASGEPMDKAGAYGIQGLGGELVKGYFGDYNTVVGLPLELTETLIREALNDD